MANIGTGHLPRAELSSGTMCSISHKGCQSLAPHLCSRTYQPQCLITQVWFFPSEPSLPTRAVKAFPSCTLRRRFTMAPRATFPSLFLTTATERGVYLQRQYGLCSLLSSGSGVSVHWLYKGPQQTAALKVVSLRINLLRALPLILCPTALFAQQQPNQFDHIISIPPRDTEICSIYNLVLHFWIFQQARDLVCLVLQI